MSLKRRLRPHPDIIMLDEFSLADMKTAVQINKSKGRRCHWKHRAA